VWRQLRTGSQVSTVHALLSLQFGAVPDVHTPPAQISDPLQALPSEQDVPSAITPLTQTPPPHVSEVQGLLSLQFALVVQVWQPAMGACAQPETELQVSTVHGLLSLQLAAAPAVQVPA
jgi:hypothetical protein